MKCYKHSTKLVFTSFFFFFNFVGYFVHVCIYIYSYIYVDTEVRQKSLYDDIISAIHGILTNRIQALPQQWKKWMDSNNNYVEKLTSFGLIPSGYFSQSSHVCYIKGETEASEQEFIYVAISNKNICQNVDISWYKIWQGIPAYEYQLLNLYTQIHPSPNFIPQ